MLVQKPGRRLIWDCETDGLLDQVTRVHILVIKDADTQQRWVFRQNNRENTILDGIKMLNEASMLIGHNIEGYDMPVFWKLYPDDFAPTGIVRDTLVMARMLYADIKERDFRLWKRGTLDGGYIGSHELGAWGQRLEFPKGDYKEVKEAEAKALGIIDKEEIRKFVWGTWNREMEDYAIQDVEVTHALWRRIEQQPWSEFAIQLEHGVHSLMGRVQENGFPFDIEQAQVLEENLRLTHTAKSDIAIQHFGKWWVPNKWLRLNKATTYVEPASGKQQKNLPKYRPRIEFGETTERQHWGEVVVPKKSMRFKDGRGDKEAGAAYCPVKILEFNPNSRQQIVNRLEKIYGWEPQEFTDKGNAIIDDDVLRDLAKTIPICDDLAEIFYYKKRLGQLVDGKNGLIGKAQERGDGKIHGRINVGGTITNRASHSNPNLGQIPRVVFLKLKQWEEQNVVTIFKQGQVEYGVAREDGSIELKELTPLFGPNGKQIIGVPKLNKMGEMILDADGNVETKASLMKGRVGDHGWDFRNLFYVPPGWRLMGADQKGIELRCLGHYMAEFDGGEYLRLVVESSPHDLHQQVLELDSRDTAKTFLYAMLYGAQDYKLGITVDSTLAMYPTKAKALGAEMRRRLMTRIPAFGAVVKSVQRQAKRGYLDALDGRQLYVRSKHSALNTLLQGAAATIAKLWCCNMEQFCEDDGLVHGWEGEFAMLAWIHDEQQTAFRDTPEILDIGRRNAVEAAAEAGERLGFRTLVEIDVKFGERWSQTH